jgi:hypothetical protein
MTSSAEVMCALGAPINVNDKEKIAHLNAERLLGLGQNARTQKRTLASASWSRLVTHSVRCRFGLNLAIIINNLASGLTSKMRASGIRHVS